MKKYAPRVGYDDLRINQFVVSPAGSPALASFGGGVYPVSSWSFANNGTYRGVDGCSQWTHNLVRNAPIYLHVHMSTTGAVAAGVVLGFFVSVRFQKTGSEAPFEGVYWCSHTVPGGGYGAKRHVMTDDVAIDLTQVAPSGLILVEIFRVKGTVVATLNAGNVTESVNDVLWLHELDFHYKGYGFGGPTPAVPWS